MGLFANLVARLGMDTTAWTAGAKAAKGEVKDLQDKTKSGFKSMLADLNGTFGKRSTLSTLIKLSHGGGAIGALNAASKEVEALTGKLVELKEAYKNGSMSAGEMTEKLIQSIPIISGVYNATRNLQELVTGEEAEKKKSMDAWKASIKVQNDASDAMHKHAIESDKFVKSSKETTEQLKRQATLEGITDETKKAIQQATFEAEDELKKLNEKVKETIDQNVIDSLKNKISKHKNNGPNDGREIQALKTELKALEKLKQDILEQAAKEEEAINDKKNAAIQKANEEASEKEIEQAEKQYEAMRDAQEEAKDKQVAALRKLQSMYEEGEKGKDVDYRTAESPAARIAHLALNSPTNIQTKIYDENKRHTDLLTKVNEKLDALGEKEDRQDQLIEIAGIN